MTGSPKSKRLIPSIFVGALVLFLLANSAGFVVFKKYKEDVQDDFTAVALQKSDTRPDVVFSGSSTVLYPLYQLDGTVYGATELVERYTRVRFVEDALAKTWGEKAQVNNISFLGFMVSDDLFIVKNYLTGKHAPRVLVLMVAPRDFCDSLFQSPATGIAFRKLADWSKTLEFCGTYLTEPNDYIDFALGKGMFSFSIRAKLQEKVHDYLLSHWQKIQAHCGTPPQKQDAWQKSIREYSIRYKNISFESMHRQFVFLNRLLATCKERNIKVVLLNAPLTSQSLSMLPPGLYESYCKELGRIAEAGSCQYFDFARSTEFSTDDFLDTVHLNSAGARKILAHVLPTIAQDIGHNRICESKPTRTASASDLH